MDMTPPMNDPMMGGMNDPNGGMPPMDDPNMMGGDPNAMGGMNDPNGGSEFDTDFDAGVEADENTDPKKFIQQLTGKLSQSLRKYNSELPQPDEELSKYVAGMILKQTTEGLTDGDKKDIIDKVNGNASEGSDDDMMDGGNDMMPMDDPNAMGGPDGGGMPPMGGNQPMMESVNHRALVNEIFQELTQKQDNSRYDIAQRPIKNIGFRKKPFTAPRMR